MYATIPARYSPDPSPSQKRVGVRVVRMGDRQAIVRAHSHPRRDLTVPRALVKVDAA